MSPPGSPPKQDEDHLTVESADTGARKRTRDAATDPSTPTDLNEEAPASGTTPTAKRNRLQSRLTPPPDQDLEGRSQQRPASTSPPATPPGAKSNKAQGAAGEEEEINEGPPTPVQASAEVENVKNIRRQVRDMTTAEEVAAAEAAAAEGTADNLEKGGKGLSGQAEAAPASTLPKSQSSVSVALGESAASKGVDLPEGQPLNEETGTDSVVSSAPGTPLPASTGPVSSPPPKSSFATFSSAASPFSSVPGSSTSAFGQAPTVPPASLDPLPVSRPNLAALQQMEGSTEEPPKSAAAAAAPTAAATTPGGANKSRLSEIRRAPSPASSVRAETGSNYEPSAPLTRRSSVSSTVSKASDDTKPAGEEATVTNTKTSSTKPSPFAAVSSAASPFAKAGSSSGAGEGKAPAAAFGSFSGFSSPFSKAAACSSTLSSATAATAAAGSASPFAKMAAAPSSLGKAASDLAPQGAAGDSQNRAAANAEDTQAFGALLRDSGATAATAPTSTTSLAERPTFKELDEVITGEEADETLFSARSKLFVMENDNYREAGTGSMRVNKSLTASKPSYRLLMRAEATHRLLLNAPLFSKMAFEVVESKYVRLSVIEDGKNKTYLVKCGNMEVAKTLFSTIKDAVAGLEADSGRGASEEASAV